MSRFAQDLERGQIVTLAIETFDGMLVQNQSSEPVYYSTEPSAATELDDVVMRLGPGESVGIGMAADVYVVNKYSSSPQLVTYTRGK